ncbi:MAG: STAS domain-containing protein [Planctomyces sp.]|nr:STAS domain-containing protein [Planctomyces sp.]
MTTMKHLKIFGVEQFGPAVVLTPEGDASNFRYRDLQAEANSLRAHLMKPGCQHLIVDLHRMQYFGSEFIGAIVSMLREVRARGGKAMFCSANEQMLQVLQNMSLFRLWPHYATREEALASLGEPTSAS